MEKRIVKPKNTFMNLAESKRESIIAAMVDEFALNGYRKASLNTIVSRAGISKGSLYQYFSSKEEIFIFVFDHFTTLVKRAISAETANLDGGRADFWGKVKGVLLVGIAFVDRHPEYFQLYLRVLFEHDLPKREELIARVRLFSKEYFTPVVKLGIKEGLLRSDISIEILVFSLDAMLDRFLQGYSKKYLDGGLELAQKSGRQLDGVIDEIIGILKDGLSITGRSQVPQ